MESLCLWRPVQPTPSNSCPPCLPPPSVPPCGTAAAAATEELRSRPAPEKAFCARHRRMRRRVRQPSPRASVFDPGSGWNPPTGSGAAAPAGSCASSAPATGGPPEPIGRNRRSQTHRDAARPLWPTEDGRGAQARLDYSKYANAAAVGGVGGGRAGTRCRRGQGALTSPARHSRDSRRHVPRPLRLAQPVCWERAPAHSAPALALFPPLRGPT